MQSAKEATKTIFNAFSFISRLSFTVSSFTWSFLSKMGVRYVIFVVDWCQGTGRISAYHSKKNKSSAVAEMGDRLVTIDMGRKWGGAAVGAGSPSNTM